jgi:hypothetical protein
MQVEEEKYDSHEVFTDFAANGTFAQIVTTAAPSPILCSKILAEKVKGKAVLKAELYRWVAARSEKGLQYFIPLASLATTYLSSQNRQSVELHLLQLAEQARQVPLDR